MWWLNTNWSCDWMRKVNTRIIHLWTTKHDCFVDGECIFEPFEQPQKDKNENGGYYSSHSYRSRRGLNCVVTDDEIIVIYNSTK